MTKKKKPTTSTERVQKMREKLAEQGLTEVRGAYAPKVLHDKIREYTGKLVKKASKET